ncbi:hypothetical protein KDX32_14765 [Burkholderia ambifaria]|uniref:hypothetical protein n=1 Tax=Burkholderia ambifaria TaxID=152480 RepID=UPI001B95C364|nr:hypothetical protein [Burkholderia ambifaria]MBR8064349.1 hypothetical protein [Burkholderia ambifaria]
MSSQLSTRVLFQQEISAALGVSEQDLRTKYDDPAISLQIIEPEKVGSVVAPWPDILNWDYAKKRATIFHRSCFVGVSTGASANIAALALVKVSKHRVTTSLLFLQKDDDAGLPPGRAMAMMDIVLESIAAVFESTTIAIDTPVDDDLVTYYKGYGYTTEKRLDGRLLLTKPA